MKHSEEASPQRLHEADWWLPGAGVREDWGMSVSGCGVFLGVMKMFGTR